MTLIKNMSIDAAMNKCAQLSTSPFFLKVDDDMFLHPKTVAFYKHMLTHVRFSKAGEDNLALFTCHLWECWKSRIVRCIKAYNTSIAREIGFRRDRRGKIDFTFRKAAASKNYRMINDKSIVAIHALRHLEDQKVYRDVWIQNSQAASPEQFAKWDKDQYMIFKKDIPYSDQYKKIARILIQNREYRGKDTRFWKFCNNKLTDKHYERKR
jgi:hypothetical protein